MDELSNRSDLNYIIGNYMIDDFIGQGSFSKVYRARHMYMNKQICIKIVQSDPSSENLKDALWLWHEAQVLQALDHKNIVCLLDLIIKNNQIYMLTDYVDGGDLATILESTSNPLPLDEVDHIIEQIADGLHYAHQKQVIHRDLKPHNILRYKDGRIVIADFGLAKIINTTSSQSSQPDLNNAGTPAYMAPEQFTGNTDYGSDLYSLGVIAYQLLTGQLPFGDGSLAQEGHCHKSPPPLRDFNAELSPAIEQVVLKMLAKNPQERYQSSIEFSNALHSAITKQVPKVSTVNSRNGIPRNGIQGTAAWLPVTQNWQRWLFIIIMVCAALVFFPYEYSLHNFSLTSKPTLPTSSSTPIPYAKATSTPVVSSSASNTGTNAGKGPVVPPPTAIPPPTISPTSTTGFSIPQRWQLVLANSLTSAGPNGQDWASNSSDCNFLSNGYQDQATGSDTCNYGSGNVHAFTNLAYSVHVIITQGRQAGLIFRLLDNNYYAFDISIDGTYVVTRHSKANGGNDQVLLGTTYSVAIRQGLNQENTLAIIASGNHFQFWINNHQVSSVDDATYSSGTIGTGINAFNNDNEGTAALFQQAQVWTPGA